MIEGSGVGVNMPVCVSDFLCQIKATFISPRAKPRVSSSLIIKRECIFDKSLYHAEHNPPP